MESALDFHTAKALLEWQVELGATDAIGDAPVNRYEVPERPVKARERRNACTSPPLRETQMWMRWPRRPCVGARRTGSRGVAGCDGQAFEHCDLKRGARNLVFADGNPQARV